MARRYQKFSEGTSTERTVFFSPIGGLRKNLEDTKGPYLSYHIGSKEGCPKRIGGIDKVGDSDRLDGKFSRLKMFSSAMNLVHLPPTFLRCIIRQRLLSKNVLSYANYL